jgi:hypothetical protein
MTQNRNEKKRLKCYVAACSLIFSRLESVKKNKDRQTERAVS